MLSLKESKDNLFALANILSFAALFFIWIATVTLFKGQFYSSLGFAFIAFLFDALDGWAARKHKTTSGFGRLLDGQIDTLVHLFYPTLVFYLHFKLTDPLSILILFIFLAAGIFRLVRFNVAGLIEKDKKAYYPGLPVFVNNFLILILIPFNKSLSAAFFRAISLTLITTVSGLMVQKFPFPKPKRIYPVIIILTIIILFLFFAGKQ